MINTADWSDNLTSYWKVCCYLSFEVIRSWADIHNIFKIQFFLCMEIICHWLINKLIGVLKFSHLKVISFLLKHHKVRQIFEILHLSNLFFIIFPLLITDLSLLFNRFYFCCIYVMKHLISILRWHIFKNKNVCRYSNILNWKRKHNFVCTNTLQKRWTISRQKTKKIFSEIYIIKL